MPGMTPCSLVRGYQLLEEIYCLHLLSTLRLFYDNGDRAASCPIALPRRQTHTEVSHLPYCPTTPANAHRSQSLSCARASASAVLLFLCATAVTALLTSVPGHRKMRHARRVPCLQGTVTGLRFSVTSVTLPLPEGRGGEVWEPS